MKKKLVIAIILVAIITCMAFILSACAQDSVEKVFVISNTKLIRLTDYGKKLDVIKIPSGVTVIDDKAFESANATRVEIPKNVTIIRSQAFVNCNKLRTIIIDSENSYYKSEGNCIIEKKSNTVIAACRTFSIPNYAEAIGDYAFYKHSDLKSIDIPKSVKSIGNYSFSSCDSLTSVDIPDGVKEIGSSAFAKCENLTGITIANSVERIGDSAFVLCGSLIRAELSSSLKAIEKYTFEGCYNLSYLKIPNQVESIGDWAFASCRKLSDVTFPSSLKVIGEGAFGNCYSLKSVKLPEGFESICKYAFAYCSNLESVEIPTSIKLIEESAFSDCRCVVGKYRGAELPEGFTIWYVTGDTYVPIVVDSDNNGMATDGYMYVVENGIRYALKDGYAKVNGHAILSGEVVVKDSITYKYSSYIVTEIDESAFEYCGMSGIVLPKSIEKIGESAFRECRNLKRIDIPNNVKIIEQYAFSNCDKLTIYCEAESQPEDWSDDWNLTIGNKTIPVKWGEKIK